MSEMPSRNAVRKALSQRPSEIFRWRPSGNEVGRKKEAGQEEWQEVEISIFSRGGVLVRTKLSGSNHDVWDGEFLKLVLKTVWLMFAVLWTVWIVDTAAAQSIFGRIAGTVTDSQGGSVAGVKITIVNEETKLERRTTTDLNGYFVASDLPVGVYSVIAEQSGFKTLKKTGNEDRKSTRLNSSHSQISYAVFCLKKKKTTTTEINQLYKKLDSDVSYQVNIMIILYP